MTVVDIIKIRPASRKDIKSYTSLLQEVYEKTYTNNKLGLTKDCFSKRIFSLKDMQDYLLSNLKQSKKQKAWLVFINSKLVGSATIINRGEDFELRGFYVNTKHQGKGIGKTLLKKALSFADGKDIVLDTYAHNYKTISIYKKWGFKVDRKKGIFYRHWPEWPDGLKAKCIYMRLKQNK